MGPGGPLVQVSNGCQYSMKLDRVHMTQPSLHPFRVVHWVPEQLNIKVVIGDNCKLIDGCSLKLCLTTHSVVSSDICHIKKLIKLHDSIVMVLS